MPLVKGKSMWSFITTPSTKFPPPTYQITLLIDDETADDFSKQGFKVKDTDDGKALFIKRWATRKDGTPNPVPKLIDADKEPLNVAIGNGSDVVVQYRTWEVTNEYGFHKGLELQAVQVLNLIEYNPTTADGEELGLDSTDDSELEF